MTVHDPMIGDISIKAGNRAGSSLPVMTPPQASAISAARASDLFDLLVAGTTAGGSAALAYIAYNTAFNGQWLLRLPDDPFSFKMLGLIALAFGGFRIVAMAYDQSPSGGIMHRSREIRTRSRLSRTDGDDGGLPS